MDARSSLRAVLIGALGLGVSASSWAAPPAVHVGVSSVPATTLSSLTRHENVVVATAEPSAEPPGRDVVLQQATRLYASMEFARAQKALQQSEADLVRAQRPSPERTARLSDVELFLGVCALLAKDAKAAEERLAFAKGIQPGLIVDPVFPPEVKKAFAASRPGPVVAVDVVLQPTGARLWIDGHEVDPAHGVARVVVERGGTHGVHRRAGQLLPRARRRRRDDRIDRLRPDVAGLHRLGLDRFRRPCALE